MTFLSQKRVPGVNFVKVLNAPKKLIQHAKNHLVILKKFWDLGRPPPHVGKKFPNNTVIFLGDSFKESPKKLIAGTSLVK